MTMNQSDLLKLREDIMTEQEQRYDTLAKNSKDVEHLLDDYNEEDLVNNPSHYKSGNMEVIEVIDEFVPDPYSYYMGNVIKYVLRHMQKGKEKQDLEKARWYLNKMIEEWDV